MLRKGYFIVGVAASLVAFLWLVSGGLSELREATAERKYGRAHVFPRREGHKFLPDAVTYSRALEALQVQGFDTNRWRVMPYLQNKAPDGTKDNHLCRNLVDDNKGVVTFTNAAGKTRQVYVSMTNGTVICSIQQARVPFR